MRIMHRVNRHENCAPSEPTALTPSKRMRTYVRHLLKNKEKRRELAHSIRPSMVGALSALGSPLFMFNEGKL